MLPASVAYPRPVLKALPSPFLPCFKLLPLSRPKARDEPAQMGLEVNARLAGPLCTTSGSPLQSSGESPTRIEAKPVHLLLLLFPSCKINMTAFLSVPCTAQQRCQLLRLAVGRKGGF